MEKLLHEAKTLFGFSLNPRQISQLVTFEKELMSWNEKMNLTAIRDVEGIRSKHFLDSISCSLAWKEQIPRRLIDVGTGAGFPGLVLKICYPALKLTLVESVGKKANFCSNMAQLLELDNVTVLSQRAEDVGQDTQHREKYDWAVGRAVAAMPVLVEYLLPLVRVGGGVLAQKGESGPAEANEAARAMKLLGGQLRQVVKVELPGVADDRYLVVIDKTAGTPSIYPRKAGTPAKKPL